MKHLSNRLPLRLGRLLLAGSLALLTLWSCSGEHREAATAHYDRLDLLVVRPHLESDPAKRGRRVETLHGRLEEDHANTVIVTGTLEGLRQPTATRLVSELPEERVAAARSMVFSFEPLPADGETCECEFVVRTRTDRGERELSRTSVPKDSRFATATVAVPLEGAPSAVILAVEPLAGEIGRAIWGAPEIVFERAEQRPPVEKERPSVLWIIADTLRADALGAGGRDPSWSPTLDWLAGESEVWTRAFSSLNATNPSFASMFTGLYAKNHNVYDWRTKLGLERTTLGELFSSAGYSTGAIFAARHLRPIHLNQGFDDVFTTDSVFSGRLAVDHGIRWLEENGTDDFFLMVHMFDVHMPHTPPLPYAAGRVPARRYGLGPVEEWRQVHDRGIPALEFEGLGGGARDLYQSEVAWLDRQIDRLLGSLESLGLDDSTIIAFTSDHGENLIDHEIHFDHRGLYDTTTHVPLMIRWLPEMDRQGTRDALVQNMDLFVDLATGAGIEVPPGIDAQALPQGENERATRRAVFAEHANHNGESLRERDTRFTVWRGRNGGAVPMLFQHKTDPGEEHSVAGENPELVARYSKAIDAWLALRPYSSEAQPAELSEEALEQLRALGYID